MLVMTRSSTCLRLSRTRLTIYTGIPPTPALTNIFVKIIVEPLSTLALATKQVKQGRFSEFFLAGKKLD